MLFYGPKKIEKKRNKSVLKHMKLKEIKIINKKIC
jgi:hypothetical protein